MRTSLLILLALLIVPSAAAAGPWLGVSHDGNGWTAAVHSHTTTVRHGDASLTLPGNWGIPVVTLHEDVGGLSADGSTLVLAQGGVAHPNGDLAKTSSFAILSTRPLGLGAVITLNGDFGFDALSPDGRTLYLIQHMATPSLLSYRVRAYDVAAKHLLPQVIADKRQRGWTMEGYPVSRASTSDGHWVYTLYSGANNYPFVHALDAVKGTAVCVGIPWNWATDQAAINNATLAVKGGKLSIGGRFVLDRATFMISKS